MKSISRADWSKLIFGLAFVLGTFIRFNVTSLAGFPINDGGMFAVMVEDLKSNHYLIPGFTSYNQFSIPFAYPPLGFYFGALATDIFHMDAIQALRWVPAFFASLSIPAFYLLAKRILKNDQTASLSTMFFALMPRAFSWFVMGGGLTRSPGQFFMILTLYFVMRLYQEEKNEDIFWSGVFGGLAVLSHPEAAVHTAVSAFLFWIMLSRKRESFIRSLLVGFLVLVVTSLWWGTVLKYHGISPLLNAAQTGQKLLAVFHLLFFVFTEEPYATVIAVLGLIGMAAQLVEKNYFLPIWMVIPFFVEGRSAAGPASIPLAILAAIGLANVVIKGLESLTPTIQMDSSQVPAHERNITIYLLLYLLFSAYQFGFRLSSATLYPPDQEAMVWVRENTPTSAHFLVLTGTDSVSCDSVLEWFPALTGRQSLFTVQGTEWTKGDVFGRFIGETYDLQSCYDKDVSCIGETISSSDYDYVYLSKTLRVNNCQLVSPARTFKYFIQSVLESDKYEVLYESDGVLIYANR